VIVAYIDAYKHQFGVEPICRVLTDHDVPIAPSTYYAFKSRPRSARRLSDERLLPLVRLVHAVNYSVYGVRKMWHALKRLGEHIGRDQVARLMRLAGLRGVSRRRRQRRVWSEGPVVRAEDLVRRDWFRDAPDVVWVADFTYVRTREGWMYVSFLQDAFSRRILGFAVRSSKGVELVTRTLLQAVNERQRASAQFIANGVIVHSDAGSQYTSLAFTEKLLDLGLSASVGRVGTAYDNALIESTIGLYKTECQRSLGSPRGRS
jgi:putative transposase